VDDEEASGLPAVDPPWDIRLEGRRWTVDLFHARGDALPEKMELIDGRLFWSQRERLAMLAALLENVGLAEAVRLAPREHWLEALDSEPG
jgi:hypothetical protein